MIELLNKEVLAASSSLGEYLCPAAQYDFFSRLIKSDKLEITDIFYGDKYAYDCPVLVVACKGSAEFQGNGIMISSGKFGFNEEIFYLELCLDGSWEVQVSNKDYEPLAFIDFTADIPAVI